MSDRDLLIGRIVDREDSPSDWTRFDGLAADDRGAQNQLLAALRDDSLLRSAVGDVIAVAERVDIDPGRPARRRALIHWGGWMAAAVLALIWMATDPRMKRAPVAAGPEVVPGGTVTGAETGAETGAPETTVPARLASDRFVRDLPNVMVETRRIPNSDQTEVLYVRRVLERTVVSGAYTLAVDEIGQPFRVQADLTQFTPKRRY